MHINYFRKYFIEYTFCLESKVGSLELDMTERDKDTEWEFLEKKCLIHF